MTSIQDQHAITSLSLAYDQFILEDTACNLHTLSVTRRWGKNTWVFALFVEADDSFGL